MYVNPMSKGIYTKCPMTNLQKEVNYNNYNKLIRIKISP